MDRGAGDRGDTGTTTIPVGLRDIAMPLETPGHGLQLALRRTRLVQSSKCLVFPDHPRGDYADGGFVPARLASVWRLDRGVAVPDCVPEHGRLTRDTCLHHRTRLNLRGVAD